MGHPEATADDFPDFKTENGATDVLTCPDFALIRITFALN